MSRTVLLSALLIALALGGAAGAQLAGATPAPHSATATNPDGTSGPPENTVAPTLNLTGTVKTGTTLTCSPGLWADDPTAYRYRWSRNGKLISGADSARYRTAQDDAGARVGCQVNAHNDQGYGSTVDTATVTVRSTCPAAGTLGASSAGPFALGTTAAVLRQRDATVGVRAGFDDFCVAGGPIVRVGFPSATLLKQLSPGRRHADSGRAVLVLSANPAYVLSGVRTGTTLSSAQRARLHLTGPLVIGANTWYVLHHSRTAAGVLQVRANRVTAVGLLDAGLAGTAAHDRSVLASF